MMSVRISKSVRVDAPVEQVFAYIANWRNTTRIQPEFRTFQPLNAEEVSVGVELQAQGRFYGLPITVRLKVVEFEPNQRMVTEVNGGLRSLNAWLFEPLGAQQTKLIFVNEYALPGVLQRLVGGNGFVQREVARMTEHALLAVKAEVEAASREG